MDPNPRLRRDWCLKPGLGFFLIIKQPTIIVKKLFHQAIGAAEAAVKPPKLLLKMNKIDFEKVLLAYRNTLLETGFSPAELL